MKIQILNKVSQNIIMRKQKQPSQLQGQKIKRSRKLSVKENNYITPVRSTKKSKLVSRSRSKTARSTAELKKQKQSLRQLGNHLNQNFTAKNSMSQIKQLRSNMSFGKNDYDPVYAIQDINYGPMQMNQKTRQNEFFPSRSSWSKTSQEHPCYSINIKNQEEQRHIYPYIQTTSTFFKEPPSENTRSPCIKKAISSIKKDTKKEQKKPKKKKSRSVSRKSCSKSRKSRSKSRSKTPKRKLSKTPKQSEDNGLVYIPPVWHGHGQDGQYAVNIPGQGSFVLSNHDKSFRSLQTFEKDQDIYGYGQVRPQSHRSLSFENYQMPEERFKSRQSQGFTHNKNQNITLSSDNSDIDFLRQSGKKINRLYQQLDNDVDYGYPTCPTLQKQPSWKKMRSISHSLSKSKKKRKRTSSVKKQKSHSLLDKNQSHQQIQQPILILQNSWEHIMGSMKDQTPTHRIIQSEQTQRVEIDHEDLKYRQESRFQLLKSELQNSLIDMRQTKLKLQCHDSSFKEQVEKISKRVECILIDQQERDQERAKDQRLKNQIERDRLERLKRQTKQQEEMKAKMLQKLSKHIDREMRNAKRSRVSKINQSSESRSFKRRKSSQSRSRMGSITSIRSKKSVKRAKQPNYQTQAFNSKNSTIVHQCEASASSARPNYMYQQAVLAQTNRQYEPPQCIQASTDKRLRFEDCVGQTALFNKEDLLGSQCLSSDCKPSSKASFGRKSILKNSSAKKRLSQRSIDSEQLPNNLFSQQRIRPLYSNSSDSEFSAHRAREIQNLKWKKLNIDKMNE